MSGEKAGRGWISALAIARKAETARDYTRMQAIGGDSAAE